MPGSDVAALRIHGLTSISDGRVQEAGGNSLFQNFFLDSLVGLGQILSYATRWIKPNQIRIRKRELDASNNRSFASEFVSSEYDFTALISTHIKR